MNGLECKEVIKEKMRLDKKLFKETQERTGRNIPRWEKKANKICRDNKKKWMRSKFNEIDVLSKQNETRTLYMVVTKINKGY
jgi:hypothetical protein